MSNRVVICLFCFLCIISAQTPYIPTPYDRPEIGDVTEPQGPGEINWTQQVIKAKGWGIIDTTLPKPQARLMATRAAQVVAQRNLLEIIKGVRVVSETKVQDLMTRSDYVYTRIEGVVKGAQMIGEPIEKDGMIEVEMAIGIYDSNGIAPPIQKGLGVELAKLASLTKQEKEEIKKVTGLVIDATGTNAKPAIFPRILDEDGNVLFDPAQYYDPNDPSLRKLIKIITTAEKEIKKTELGDNPYVIKAIKAIHSDIVVSKEESKKVNWLKKTFQALVKVGKVLLILL